MNGTGAWLRPSGSSIGRVLVLLAALAGLFAMHGMSDHGVGGPTPTMSGVGQLVMVHGDTPHQSPARLPMDDGPHVDAAGQCLAVLVVALLIGAWLFVRGRRPVAAERPPRRTHSSVLAHLAPPRPPDLNALSIQRC